MDENWQYERFPLADLLAVRKELKTKRNYIATGGHGDGLEEHLQCYDPSLIPSLSSASLLDVQGAPENTPSFCDDPSMWNKGDYEVNIDFLTRSEGNQLQLLAHIENLLLQELENCERKKTELDKLKTECDKYKTGCDKYKTECDKYKRKINESITLYSKLVFEEEEKRNKALKEHKRMLLDVRRRIKTGGNDHHFAEDFMQHKRLQEKEHAIQRTRLQRVSESSFTDSDKLSGKINKHAGEKFILPCIKKDNGKIKSLGRYVHPKHNGASFENNHVAIVLPHINSEKKNLVCRAEVSNGQDDDWYSTIVGEMVAKQKDTLPDHH